jgi:predicted regulator of Ras-like GTPase activity (Roadblock/LC7/MglB family)
VRAPGGPDGTADHDAGGAPEFDSTAFASLAAADFSANDQLASMIGEQEFSSLFHQGEKESMYLADVAKRVILVVLFDDRATLGMIRIKVKTVVRELTDIFRALFSRSARRPPSRGSRPPGPTRPRTRSTASSEVVEEAGLMSMINYASREINCKIVYYGPGLCGKTTNLEYVYDKVAPNTRGKLISSPPRRSGRSSSTSSRWTWGASAASRRASTSTRCRARSTTTPPGSSS